MLLQTYELFSTTVLSIFVEMEMPNFQCTVHCTQRFLTWGTRVICDTLTKKIVTLRLYFYVTLLKKRYKENYT